MFTVYDVHEYCWLFCVQCSVNCTFVIVSWSHIVHSVHSHCCQMKAMSSMRQVVRQMTLPSIETIEAIDDVFQ